MRRGDGFLERRSGAWAGVLPAASDAEEPHASVENKAEFLKSGQPRAALCLASLAVFLG